MKKYTILVCCISVLWFCAAARAADVYLSLSAHGQRSDMGIGGFVPETPTIDESRIGRELQDVLRYDLLFSRYFNIQEDGPFYTGQEAQLTRWKEQGVGVLVCGKLTVKDRYITLTGQLIDVASGQVIWEKVFKRPMDDYRRLAHDMNDEIVLHFTGERGIAHTRIAFVNDHTGHKEIYLADYDGQNARQLTRDNSINLLPAWSPDGKELLYTTYRFGNPDLYAVTPDGDRLRPVSQRQGLNSAAAFAPDGETIAVTLSMGKSPSVYVIKKSGEILKRLTFGNDIGTSPSFAPNGKEIVYVSDNPGYPQLFLMDVFGSNVRRLPMRGFCDSPAWSPRGDKIVFAMRVGKEDDTYDLYIYDLSTSNVSRLTQNEGNNENPAWSPDGRFIVFSSNRSGRHELYVVAVDGSGIRKLTSLSGDSYMPDWSR